MIAGLTEMVKEMARRHGFGAVGIAAAGPVPRAQGLHEWLAKGYDAGMAYMRRNLDKRLRPDLLVPGARSVICLAVAYAPADDDGTEGLIARYARGRDYHEALKARCAQLMAAIVAIEPSFQGRSFVDSAPVMERSLAATAGLGWIGRNGCLITQSAGSFALLCEIVCNLPLEADGPLPGSCGDCRACVAACPTGALDGSGLVDAHKCVSCWTIEQAGEIDAETWPKMGRRVFGCDACQLACPHNHGLPAGDSELSTPLPLARAGLGEMLTWSRPAWEQAAAGTAVLRAGYDTFRRNAIIAAGNSDDPSLLPALRGLAATDGYHGLLARWAVERLERAAKSFDPPGGSAV